MCFVAKDAYLGILIVRFFRQREIREFITSVRKKIHRFVTGILLKLISSGMENVL